MWTQTTTAIIAVGRRGHTAELKEHLKLEGVSHQGFMLIEKELPDIRCIASFMHPTFVDHHLIARFSSTLIRERLKRKEPLGDLAHPEVAKYLERGKHLGSAISSE